MARNLPELQGELAGCSDTLRDDTPSLGSTPRAVGSRLQFLARARQPLFYSSRAGEATSAPGPGEVPDNGTPEESQGGVHQHPSRWALERYPKPQSKGENMF